jgi:FtsP/CotA-like multicopper oxidase with cupredoxin domain
MNRKVLTCLGVATGALLWGTGQASAQYVPPPALAPGVNYMLPNYANSPVLTKFVDPLPGVKAAGAAIQGWYYNNATVGPLAGRNIPVAVADTTKFPGSAYYEIAVVDYAAQMHTELGPTKLRGYVQIHPPGSGTAGVQLFYVDSAGNPTTTPIQVDIGTPTVPNLVNVYAYENPTYLGPIILATKGTPTRIKFYNLLPAGTTGDLFIPADTTVDGAGMGPDGTAYPQNRTGFHLHGGDNPWISDGTAHQWITPAGETRPLNTGVSQRNVPDMPLPAKGSATFFWPNGQSGRLMFYHDHAFGITRLGVYAGEAAGYLLVDSTEGPLNAFAPGGEVPLIIQDKGFVNDGTVPAAFKTAYPTAATPPATTAVDPLWGDTVNNPDAAKWGQTKGSLWWPHVYMPNQNPNDLSGANPLGRVDYGAWFWPVFPSLIPPTTSIVPEGFMDTPVINGAAYPSMNVDPKAYRFRILNACNDRFVNLQLYVAASSIVGGITVNPGGGGSGYTAPPLVTITPAAGDTTGQGAVAVATIDTLVGSPTFGQVTAVTVTIVGSGYTAAPTVTIAPPTAGTAATATATLYTSKTEVGMVPADINSPTTTWPAGWTVQTPGMIPDIIDNRPGGLPDPRNIGPDFIQIGTEGGLLPTPAVLPVTPVGYVQNKRDITVGSIGPNEHTLLLGPAERGDVIIDFSQFAGKTLILYSDSPAPVPAGDPRNDYYTAGPDMTSQGGTPPTQPGFGPNTRTLMQIVVSGTVNGTAIDVAGLTTTLAAQYTASQLPPPIVPRGSTPGVNVSRISDTSLTVNGVTTPLLPKTIQELFDTYGRMNATLGVEIPFTTATIQTTIPYGFADPATEVIPDGATQLWKITHNGVDTHAVHFHLFNVQLVNRVGWDGAIRLPESNELGWKETVRMNPLEDIIVALKAKTPTVPVSMGVLPNNIRPLDPSKPPTFSFTGVVDPSGAPVAAYLNYSTNFGNEYTWHCHLLGHEENDMMRPIMMAVPPAAPTALAGTLTSVKQGSTTTYTVKLTWSAAVPGPVKYTLQRAKTPDFLNGLFTFNVGTATTYADVVGTSFTTPYFYRVWATSVVGSGVAGFPAVTNTSPASITLGPPTGIVTLVSVVQAATAKSPIVLTWSIAGNGQTGYKVQRATNSGFTTGLTTITLGNVTTYSDPAPTGTITYYYRVIPTNFLGDGAASNVRSITAHK